MILPAVKAPAVAPSREGSLKLLRKLRTKLHDLKKLSIWYVTKQ